MYCSERQRPVCYSSSITRMRGVGTLRAAATACCSGLSSGAGATSAAEAVGAVPAGAAAAGAAAGAGSMAGTGEASSAPSVLLLASVKAVKAALAMVSAAAAFASSSAAACVPFGRSQCCNNAFTSLTKLACPESPVNVALKLWIPRERLYALVLCHDQVCQHQGPRRQTSEVPTFRAVLHSDSFLALTSCSAASAVALSASSCSWTALTFPATLRTWSVPALTAAYIERPIR